MWEGSTVPAILHSLLLAFGFRLFVRFLFFFASALFLLLFLVANNWGTTTADNKLNLNRLGGLGMSPRGGQGGTEIDPRFSVACQRWQASRATVA